MADAVLTGGEALVRALAAHEVTRTFGIPGPTLIVVPEESP